ncbi:MAG: hypothetical protein ACWGQW_09390, partial [bacterium]
IEDISPQHCCSEHVASTTPNLASNDYSNVSLWFTTTKTPGSDRSESKMIRVGATFLFIRPLDGQPACIRRPNGFDSKSA